jgi:ribonuclease R
MKKEIIAYFKKNPHANVKSKQLASMLGLFDDYEIAEMKAQLHVLVKEEVLAKLGKRYSLQVQNDSARVTGRLEITRQGFGFVVPTNKKLPDVFIASRNLNTAMHGDIVEVSMFAKQKTGAKNLDGEIIHIVKRKWTSVSGILKRSKSAYYVIPDISEIQNDIYIDPNSVGTAKEGDKVLVSEIEWDSPNRAPEGKITKIFTDKHSPETEYISIMTEYNLPSSFPDPVLNEIRQLNVAISDGELKSRVDVRNEIVVTIDPFDARDFDDALSIKKLSNGNYEVGVHIADVGHYIPKGSKLDEEAIARGNSVYLCGKVIPMLPEILSNDVCSLNPNVDRLTFSVFTELTSRGKIVDYKIAKSVINSKRRFTYEEVQGILTTKMGDYAEQLLELHKLALIMRKKRTREGSVNFETQEIKFILDENNFPVEIQRNVSDDSHNLVEEFMLLANKVVATHMQKVMYKNEIMPFVYRIHDKPDEEKLKNFMLFLKSLGYKNLPSPQSIKPRMLNEVIESTKGKPEEVLVNEIAIRTMAKAIYSPDNLGHYGLGFQYYTHFTSPIRRYSDLLVHRIIFSVISGKKQPIYSWQALKDLCEHISFTERNAVEAERQSIKLKQIQFMRGHLGEEFKAVISGVANFGIFVEIIDYLSEGLIRLRDIAGDYFIYDEKKYALVGKRTGKTFRLGDPVSVKLVRIDETKLEMDFLLIDED